MFHISTVCVYVIVNVSGCMYFIVHLIICYTTVSILRNLIIVKQETDNHKIWVIISELWH